MIQLNLLQALAGNKTIAPHTGRQRVLDKILSSHDAILEFDPATGGSKEWAWPKNTEFQGGRLPIYYFAGHRATQWLAFPCCLCAQTFGKITESAIYLPAIGPYCGFWVASCAQDLCKYFVPLEGFFTKEGILEKEYPSRTPPPVLHVQESVPTYEPEKCEIPGFLDVRSLYPIIAMPRYEPPAPVKHCVDELWQRISTWPRPGIPVEQLLELFAVCKCGMAVDRRYFDSHECIRRV